MDLKFNFRYHNLSQEDKATIQKIFQEKFAKLFRLTKKYPSGPYIYLDCQQNPKTKKYTFEANLTLKGKKFHSQTTSETIVTGLAETAKKLRTEIKKTKEEY